MARSAVRRIRGDADRDGRRRLHAGPAVERATAIDLESGRAAVDEVLRRGRHRTQRRQRRRRARSSARRRRARSRSTRRRGRRAVAPDVAQRPGDVVDMAPGYEDGTVYVSTAVAGAGAVGTLWALDAQTGKAKWRWEQVPADLWGDADGQLRWRHVASARLRRTRAACTSASPIRCPSRARRTRRGALADRARTDGRTRSSSSTPTPARCCGAARCCRTTCTTGTSRVP